MRNILFFSVLLLVTIGLWSNGKGESKAAETAAPVKVVLLYNTSPLPPVESNPILQKLNEELDMKLEFNGIDTEYQQQLNIKLAGGTPPDLFMVDVVSLQTYSKQGTAGGLGSLSGKPDAQFHGMVRY
jgi:putative aldouronate transport system substrate-binding protein